MSTFNINDLHTKALCHEEQLRWFNALFNAIKADQEKDVPSDTADLVELGRYLAQDLGNYADLELDQITKEMEGE